MTIWAEQAQIFKAVIVTLTIQVIELKDERTLPPFGDAAACARVRQKACCHQAFLEPHAIRVGAPLHEYF